MTNTLSNMLEDFFGNNPLRGFADNYSSNQKPAVNIVETPEQYTMAFSVPGIKKEDIKIDVEDKTLSVSYEHKQEDVQESEKFIKREYGYHSFTRNFSLGNSIKQDAITASFENGILTLVLPKKDEVKPVKKQIEIS